MTSIDISRLHYPVTALGPGRRIGIWLQGCSMRCSGCISADTWAKGRGTTTVAEVIHGLARWVPDADGFTISGGEPFDQPDALSSLLAHIRSISDGDILVYSGYEYELIENTVRSLDGLIDALISDPFVLSAPHTLALRGSDNQRLHFLTPLGVQRFGPYAHREAERRFDVMVDASGEIWMAGIPGRGDFDNLRHLRESGLHTFTVSQDRSTS